MHKEAVRSFRLKLDTRSVRPDIQLARPPTSGVIVNHAISHDDHLPKIKGVRPLLFLFGYYGQGIEEILRIKARLKNGLLHVCIWAVSN